jgi:hypothetical protein
MDGVIRGTDVVKHARLIWREFGLRALLKCLRACVVGPRTTFLDIVWERRT